MYIYQLLTANGQIDRFGLLNVVAFLIALFGSIILHEIAHGLVALWNGDNTAKMYGRLSLNPIRHFDWIGLLFMLFAGFGWARPVPVNPNNFKNRKLGAITVSIAGIVTNLTIAFLAAIGVALLGSINVHGMSGSKYYFVYLCYMLMSMLLSLNVSLALFNFLPLFPLDGYRLLSCFINENRGCMVFLRKYSLYFLLGFMLLNYLPIVSAYSPLNLYLSTFGGMIQHGFRKFWELVFHV